MRRSTHLKGQLFFASFFEGFMVVWGEAAVTFRYWEITAMGSNRKKYTTRGQFTSASTSFFCQSTCWHCIKYVPFRVHHLTTTNAGAKTFPFLCSPFLFRASWITGTDVSFVAHRSHHHSSSSGPLPDKLFSTGILRRPRSAHANVGRKRARFFKIFLRQEARSRVDRGGRSDRRCSFRRLSQL